MLLQSCAVIAATVVVLLLTVIYGLECAVNVMSVLCSLVTSVLGNVVGPGIMLAILVVGICVGAGSPTK
jgi:hypothetical protein